jgi:hypothetical protein
MLHLPAVTVLVQPGCRARFLRYADGNLWYGVDYPPPIEERIGQSVVFLKTFEFPVPIDDTGTGVFLANDKAIIFMRWIRKHLAYLTKSLAEAGAP